MENANIFNAWKDAIESLDIINEIDCLRCITVNISNVCNSNKCPFCPHHYGWKSSDPKFMSIDTMKAVVDRLNEFKYSGYVVILGKGEPTLNQNLHFLLEHLDRKDKTILISNGELGNSDFWDKLSDMCSLKISIHDDSLNDKIRSKISKNVIFRNHSIKTPELTITNRGGILHQPEVIRRNCCNYPFYHVAIETSGAYLPCNQNWVREICTKYSVFNMSISDYFIHELEKLRHDLVCDR